jgi:PAS domain-containing protein
MSTSEGQSPATLKLRDFVGAVLAIAWSVLPDGSLDFVNKRFRDYTGLPWEQLTDGSGNRLSIRTISHSSKPGGRTSGSPKRLAQRKNAFAVSTELIAGSGFAAAPVHDEQANLVRWCGINTDIDDLKSFEQKLRQEATDLRTVTDSIRQSIVVLAPDGPMLYVNRVFREVTGITIRHVNDNTFLTRVFHPDDLLPRMIQPPECVAA